MTGLSCVLCVYCVLYHNLRHSLPDPIHPPYPLHRLLCLELLGDTFGGGTVFDQPKEESVGLFFNVGKVRAKLTAGLQVGIEDGMMLLKIAQPTLDPDTNGTFFFGGAI